jgi:hypothetical protein
MAYPKRFAGYDSPALLVKDPALTRDQKISALVSWRSACKRLDGRDPPGRRRLVAEIDRALTLARRGWAESGAK